MSIIREMMRPPDPNEMDGKKKKNRAKSQRRVETAEPQRRRPVITGARMNDTSDLFSRYDILSGGMRAPAPVRRIPGARNVPILDGRFRSRKEPT